MLLNWCQLFNTHTLRCVSECAKFISPPACLYLVMISLSLHNSHYEVSAHYTHSYIWQGRAETHVHYIAYAGGTELRKNQLIPWHLHCKNVAEHVSRGLGNNCTGLCKPLFWHSCSYTPKAQDRIVIWGTIFYIIATTLVVSKRKGNIQTPCYPPPSASKQTPRSLLVATSWLMPPPPGSVYAREEEKSVLQRFMTGSYRLQSHIDPNTVKWTDVQHCSVQLL